MTIASLQSLVKTDPFLPPMWLNHGNHIPQCGHTPWAIYDWLRLVLSASSLDCNSGTVRDIRTSTCMGLSQS